MRNGSKSNGTNLGGTFRGQVELKATCRDLSMIFVNAYANSGFNGDNQMLIRASITSQADGVTAIPLSVYAMRVRWRGLVLSFAATPVGQIGPLVGALAPVLRRALARPDI